MSGTITCAKVVPWTNIPVQGFLVAFGSGWTPPQYCVDELGYVRLRGLGTLPGGARPTNGNGIICSMLLCMTHKRLLHEPMSCASLQLGLVSGEGLRAPFLFVDFSCNEKRLHSEKKPSLHVDLRVKMSLSLLLLERFGNHT